MTSSPSDPWGNSGVPDPTQPLRPTQPSDPTQPFGSTQQPDPTQPFGPPEPYTPPSGGPVAPEPYTPPPAGPVPPRSLLPAPGPVPQDPGPVILQIAEISVTSTTVFTPTGDIPLAGSQWQVNDYWFAQQRIPKWAIVLAIVGFCVLTIFSLLFLLVKETVMQGTVQVTVTNGTRQYVARIPVTDQAAVTAINQQVNYVRTLAAL
ncbi:hypothetical protein ACFQS1_21035 [Paractinoplanes rhizophilus]|uniref:Uncharacterized protein n=1 Tax=Paractinoplanes rhizophilus TaxID=1416877 RepID=A0ABW2HY21_9ACTN